MYELKNNHVSPDTTFDFVKKKVLRECRDKFVPLVKNFSGRRNNPKLPRHILQAIREKKVFGGHILSQNIVK